MEFYAILISVYKVFILCKCYYNELVWVVPNSVWNFRYYKIFCEMFFFPSQIHLKTTFYTAQNFLYQLRFFILPILLLNWKKTCCMDLFFHQFCQVIEHQARRVQSFSQSFKISFLIVIGREQNYTSASLQEDHK